MTKSILFWILAHEIAENEKCMERYEIKSDFKPKLNLYSFIICKLIFAESY